MRLNPIILTQGNVNQSALGRCHRRKVDRTTLLNSTRGSRACHRGYLLMAATPIPLNIDNDWIPEPKLAADQEGDHRLQRPERSTVTTDKDRQIRCRHIENQLTFVTFVLIDGRVVSIEMSKNGTHNGNGRVGNGIELIIVELLSSLIALGYLGELTNNLLGCFFGRLFNQFLTHGKLQ